MREPGFEEFADLWQVPEENEREVFEALARRARWRGRLLAYADISLAVAIAATVAFAVFSTPHMGVIAPALLLLALVTGVTWQRRKLRQMSPTLNTDDRFAFLESSIRNANVNLRRVTLSIIITPPAGFLTTVYKRSLKDEHFWEHPLADMKIWATSWHGLFGFTVLTVILTMMIRSRRKFLRERRHLQQLADDYAAERQWERETADK